MRSSTAALRLHLESALAGRGISPFRLREAVSLQVVPTGIAALDQCAGGLPRGSLTEIYGPACSGRTSILHSVLASRTAFSEACALIDAQDAFDPSSSQSAGVLLRRLLWVRCHGIEQALRSVDLLLHGGGFGLVALDLSDTPARLVRHVPLNLWFRLRRAVEDTSTALLVLSQESNAKTCASLVLRLEREEAHWSQLANQTVSDVHSPACLLSGSAHTAEIARSVLRQKRLRFIDQPSSRADSPDASVRFHLNADSYATREALRDAMLLPLQEERIQSPG
jgi:recombination protein RecA